MACPVLILSEKRLEERRVLLEEEGLALDGSKLAIVEEPGLANATLEHLVGFPTDKTQLKRLPLTRLEAAIVMADEASDKRATGGSELQLQDSETVTSTVLLRDLHERLVKHGLATNTLTIVPQLLDILTARVFATNADILEERAETTYDSTFSDWRLLGLPLRRLHPHQVLDPNRAPARTSPQTPKTNPRMLGHQLVLRGVELLVEGVDHHAVRVAAREVPRGWRDAGR